MPISEKELRQRYMQTFNTESGQIVLKDLENRCFKHDTTHFPGDRESVLINEGRRQVLLHIETMMSPEGIAALAEKPEERKEE